MQIEAIRCSSRPPTVGRRLVAADFDGTIAYTFEPSPAGVDVKSATGHAIRVVLGDGAFSSYQEKGGLRNRAPYEVVAELRPDLGTEGQLALTRKLSREKLSILLGEIGSRFPTGEVWPRPVPGYLDFFEAFRSQGQSARTDHVILSSGHQAFIRKAFRVWGIDYPVPLVSEETSRALARTRRVAPEDMLKPAKGLMDSVLWAWMRRNGEPDNADTLDFARQHTLMVGDDLVKDGGLAHNSGTSFIHIDPLSPTGSWSDVAAWASLDMLGTAGGQSVGQ